MKTRKMNKWSRRDILSLDQNGQTELHNARIVAGVTLADASLKLGYRAPVSLWQIEVGKNRIRKEDHRFLMGYYKTMMEVKNGK